MYVDTTWTEENALQAGTLGHVARDRHLTLHTFLLAGQ